MNHKPGDEVWAVVRRDIYGHFVINTTLDRTFTNGHISGWFGKSWFIRDEDIFDNEADAKRKLIYITLTT